MDKKSGLLSKALVVGIILLFVGVAVAPSISADVDKRLTKPYTNPITGKTVEITVSRYKADGTVEKIKVILSKEKALEFAEKYRNTDDSEKRFSLLKDYGLIPDDVTRDSLRQEMLSLADELGITDEKIESISERFANNGDRVRLFGINFLNEIDGVSLLTVNLPIGLSLITGVLNWWGDFDLRSADLLYIAYYFIGYYEFYNGILPDFYSNMLGFISLLGFIGVVCSTPFLALGTIIWGFTVASLANFVIMGRYEP